MYSSNLIQGITLSLLMQLFKNSYSVTKLWKQIFNLVNLTAREIPQKFSYFFSFKSSTKNIISKLLNRSSRCIVMEPRISQETRLQIYCRFLQYTSGFICLQLSMQFCRTSFEHRAAIFLFTDLMSFILYIYLYHYQQECQTVFNNQNIKTCPTEINFSFIFQVDGPQSSS